MNRTQINTDKTDSRGLFLEFLEAPFINHRLKINSLLTPNCLFLLNLF